MLLQNLHTDTEAMVDDEENFYSRTQTLHIQELFCTTSPAGVLCGTAQHCTTVPLLEECDAHPHPGLLCRPVRLVMLSDTCLPFGPRLPARRDETVCAVSADERSISGSQEDTPPSHRGSSLRPERHPESPVGVVSGSPVRCRQTAMLGEGATPVAPVRLNKRNSRAGSALGCWPPDIR